MKIIIIYLMLAVLLLAGLCSCAGKNGSVIPSDLQTPKAGAEKPTPAAKPEQTAGDAEVVNNQLIGEAQTQEEAQQIADLYGIELISFNYGIAVFKTEEPAEDVIERGKQNCWPLLEPDHIIEAD
jgi:hypothetical protein